jgi:S-adenosylmethionine synthetase
VLEQRPPVVSVKVDTFSTGDDEQAARELRQFDFRPAAVTGQLNLLQPLYRATTNYGHFGRLGFPWEG